MKINIEVNEQQILKYVMDGMDEKEIADHLRSGIHETIVSRLQNKKQELIDAFCKERYQSLDKELKDEFVNYVKTKLNRKDFSKILKSNRMDELLSECMYEYINIWLEDNQIVLSLSVNNKKHYYPKENKR